jgi:hypothetical protein
LCGRPNQRGSELSALQPADAASNRCGSAVHSARHGGIEIPLNVDNHHVAAVSQLDMQLATFVDAASRAVDIGQTHMNPADPPAQAVKGKTDATPHVALDRFGQSKAAGLDVDTHGC